MKGDYIFNTDKFLNITSWGRGISSLTGVKPSEAIGKKYYRVISKINLSKSDAIAKVIKENQTIVFKDYPVNYATGNVKVDITISVTRDRKGIVHGAKVKFTHNPSQTHSEDLRSFSDFFEAASHAHGLRGPLNTIKGASQLLRDSRPEDNEIKEFTDLINESVSQMDTIVSRFLNLPVKRFELSDVDINSILKKVRHLISPTAIKNKIKVHYIYGDLPIVKADGLQIQQAIMNVIDNAIEAMRGNGELKITTGIEHLQEGDFVIISVSDTGPGITATKKIGRYKNGRGFGLTLTRLILHCHGGWMKIDEDKAGTIVKLYLPLKGG